MPKRSNMLDRPGLEDDREQPVPIGLCEECDEDIMPWEDAYKYDNVDLHEECITSYIIKQSRKLEVQNE
jgi:hypothetical protein